eukprot:Pgem_evm1s16648
MKQQNDNFFNHIEDNDEQEKQTRKPRTKTVKEFEQLSKQGITIKTCLSEGQTLFVESMIKKH